MNHITKQQEFERRLLTDLRSEIRWMIERPWNNYYCLVVYLWDLCNIGAACNSLQALDVDSRPVGNGLDAAEWEHLTTFIETSEFLREWSDHWYDDETANGENWNWENEYYGSIASVVEELKRSADVESATNFADDFIWGIQWADPSETAMQRTLEVSGRVNDPELHSEFMNAMTGRRNAE